MAEKIIMLGIKKEKGYLYYIDKEGDLSKSKLSRVGQKSVKMGGTKIKILGIPREKGHFYFLDKDGDVSKAIMKQYK